MLFGITHTDARDIVTRLLNVEQNSRTAANNLRESELPEAAIEAEVYGKRSRELADKVSLIVVALDAVENRQRSMEHFRAETDTMPRADRED